jgi:L-ascorbate metabolism protein UlaG (beta-lactamase superfamily)
VGVHRLSVLWLKLSKVKMYRVIDFPEIDIIFLSHDHYDYLDYETILHLRDQVKKCYTSIGFEAHQKYWGG